MGQSSWATSHRYETDSGKKFFVKMARGQDGSMFKGEALGLQAMYGELDTRLSHHPVCKSAIMGLCHAEAGLGMGPSSA